MYCFFPFQIILRTTLLLTVSLRNLALRSSDSSDLHYLKALSETANTCFQRIKSLPETNRKQTEKKKHHFTRLECSLSFQQFTLINMPYGQARVLNDNVFLICFRGCYQK